MLPPSAPLMVNLVLKKLPVILATSSPPSPWTMVSLGVAVSTLPLTVNITSCWPAARTW